MTESMSETVELLAPARDSSCAMMALRCGADAVYIGAPRFGARVQAGNSIDDIRAVIDYAHRYWARVYVTMNTLLYDDEFPDALRMIGQLYECHADGLIIQDMGLLECDLPPIPLIASTQMHNLTPERVAFLRDVGFRRVILARELTLDEIHEIRRKVEGVQLESFVHGAVCVSYSGQCSLSQARGGRSANRGDCAQPCRKSYRLIDSEGETHGEAHYLSLKDMNRADDLEAMIGAGIRSLKIEGRLKDEAYVANIVSYYRARLDAILPGMGLRRSSSGASRIDFTPDPSKTFNRGSSDYFMHGRDGSLASWQTPKMTGELIGAVLSTGPRGVAVKNGERLHTGDGVCFFDAGGELRGAYVNGVQDNLVTLGSVEGLTPGAMLYRNFDRVYHQSVLNGVHERKIRLQVSLVQADEQYLLRASDEDGVQSELGFDGAIEPANKAEAALANIQRQLARSGDSEFECEKVCVEVTVAPFLPLSALNEWRRRLFDAHREARMLSRPVAVREPVKSEALCPEDDLSYLGNVLNKRAERFYRRHGVQSIEPAAEAGTGLEGRDVMTARYCILYQMEACKKLPGVKRYAEPLYLVDDRDERLELRFDCHRCEMRVILR
ncbi:MAG: collagenase-like protease [bacterium]|nr:collagenase-like protease [bacterium]